MTEFVKHFSKTVFESSPLVVFERLVGNLGYLTRNYTKCLQTTIFQIQFSLLTIQFRLMFMCMYVLFLFA